MGERRGWEKQEKEKILQGMKERKASRDGQALSVPVPAEQTRRRKRRRPRRKMRERTRKEDGRANRSAARCRSC